MCVCVCVLIFGQKRTVCVDSFLLLVFSEFESHFVHTNPFGTGLGLEEEEEERESLNLSLTIMCKLCR